MREKIKEKNYLGLVSHILDDQEFSKIDQFEHHGLSRLDHSLKVSYLAYRIAKVLKMDYEMAARGGLLHDFFLDEEKNRLKSLFKHPKIASSNAARRFELSVDEINIIESHMFPIIPHKLPKHAVSWLVSTVDKGVAIVDFAISFKYSTNILLIFLLNILK